MGSERTESASALGSDLTLWRQQHAVIEMMQAGEMAK
jgi:hypothetical protein